MQDVPFSTWGITQKEPPFQRNAYTPTITFDVGSDKNKTDFWVLYALSAYEAETNRSFDPDGGSGVLGSSGGFIRVFCETIRDGRHIYLKYPSSVPVGKTLQSYDLILQRNLTHETLHCFLGVHDPLIPITIQGIMEQGADFFATPVDYSLTPPQIHAIQKNNNPTPP